MSSPPIGILDDAFFFSIKMPLFMLLAGFVMTNVLFRPPLCTYNFKLIVAVIQFLSCDVMYKETALFIEGN